uniref:Thyroglobulin type-1 domain-containing protein n=1 Tax=Oryzias melastigma TaxID=30732 RepID=A0A3B3B9W4_ORYME
MVFLPFSLLVFFTTFCSEEPEAPKTECEQHRERAMTCVFLNCGVSVHGILELFQCHGSTGHCWCVDSRGQERPGTRTPPGVTRVDSPKTECEQHRERAISSSQDGGPAVGGFVPQCDAEGRYLSQQCHGSTGHCWCVDSRGQERPGTRTPPGVTRVDCDRRPGVGNV